MIHYLGTALIFITDHHRYQINHSSNLSTYQFVKLVIKRHFSTQSHKVAQSHTERAALVKSLWNSVWLRVLCVEYFKTDR